jgi:hypothetical protein
MFVEILFYRQSSPMNSINSDDSDGGVQQTELLDFPRTYRPELSTCYMLRILRLRCGCQFSWCAVGLSVSYNIILYRYICHNFTAIQQNQTCWRWNYGMEGELLEGHGALLTILFPNV